jgi:hypothetical protein
MGDTGTNFQAESSEMAGDKLRGLELTVSQLGVLVDGMTVTHHLGCYAAGRSRDRRISRLGEKWCERCYQSDSDIQGAESKQALHRPSSRLPVGEWVFGGR